MLSTVSMYLWGEEGTIDLTVSGNNDTKDESPPNSVISNVHSRKRVQTQLRRVHIEMWRENVRRSKLHRESKNDTKELKSNEIIKRLGDIQTTKQFEFKDLKIEDEFVLKSNNNTEILITSIDEVENDYVFLFYPN